MSDHRSPVEKIHEELLDLAHGDDARDVDVMIELDLPIRRLTAKRGSRLASDRLRWLSAVDDADPEAEAKNGEAFRRFGAYLDTLSSGHPAALRSANAYAVTLPARELLEVAKAPLVSSVTPNWRRQV